MSSAGVQAAKRAPRPWFRALAIILVGMVFSVTVELVSLVWLIARADEARPVEYWTGEALES